MSSLVTSFPSLAIIVLLCFFFFNDTATTEIYTLSLHDALPIYCGASSGSGRIPEMYGSANGLTLRAFSRAASAFGVVRASGQPALQNTRPCDRSQDALFIREARDEAIGALRLIGGQVEPQQRKARAQIVMGIEFEHLLENGNGIRQPARRGQ